MEKNILIILGMHRSGTSVITQWLHKCGLPVGNDLLGPGTGNIEGHFEDLDFVRLHEELLLSQKLPNNGFTENAVKNIGVRQMFRVTSLINIKSHQQPQWGWKDPRTCLFLNIYREILPEARYLVIFRDYQPVVSSLISREYARLQKKLLLKNPVNRMLSKKFKRKYNEDWLYKTCTTLYLKVWIAYNEEILAHIAKLPAGCFIAVNYKALITNDKPVFLHLAHQWQFKLTYNAFGNVYQPQLMEERAPIENYISDANLLAHAKQVENRIKQVLQQFDFATEALYNAKIA